MSGMMMKQNLIAAIRQISGNKLFSFINIAGFTISLVATFFIYLWVTDERSYEHCHTDCDRIYRAQQYINHETSNKTYVLLSNIFRNHFPSVSESTYLIEYGYKSTLFHQTEKAQSSGILVDSAFWSFFTFPVVEGDPGKLKNDKRNIVLTENTARKLFGKASAIGKPVEIRTYLGRINGKEEIETISNTVVAVVKVPVRTSLQFDYAKSSYPIEQAKSDWIWDVPAIVFIKEQDKTGFTGQDKKLLSQAMIRYGNRDRELQFQKLTDIRLETDRQKQLHFQFITLAVLILFMGAFNFSVLSTARSIARNREICIRKVYGAGKQKIIGQLTCENILQTSIAFTLALCLVALFLPEFNSLTGKEIQLSFSPATVAFGLFCIFALGSISGYFPAYALSTANILAGLKGDSKSVRKTTLYRWMVTIQFIIATALVIVSIVSLKQIRYIQHKDLGLKKENIVHVNTGSSWFEIDNFRKEVLKNPDVKQVSIGESFASYAAGQEGYWITWHSDSRSDSIKAIVLATEKEAFDVYGLTLKMGEVYQADLASFLNRSSGGNSGVVINETAWKRMGIESPLGVMTSVGRICGVVKDFHYNSLHNKIQPLFLLYDPQRVSDMSIRISSGNQSETIRFLKEKYESMHHTGLFDYTFFEDDLAKNYQSEHQQSSLFLFFTSIAICIALMGVLGLVILTTRQRTREIGIRKVNGAHSGSIVRMLCWQYMKWIVVAYCIACPIARWAIGLWLENFEYQIEIGGGVYASAGIITAVIALLAIGIQSYRTASQDPVKSLRNE